MARGQATAQGEAEAATQGDETPVALNKARCANAGSGEGLSHIDETQAVGNGVDGPPKASATRVDALGQTPKDDRAKIASFVGMECEDERNNARSHAEMLRATEIVQSQLMKHMQCFCDTVKVVRAEWKGGL